MWTTGYVIFIHLFAAFEPAHRCRVPYCDTAGSGLHENHTDFSIPVEHATGHMFKSADKFDPCSRFSFTDDFSAQLAASISRPLISNDNSTDNDLTSCSAAHFKVPIVYIHQQYYFNKILPNTL